MLLPLRLPLVAFVHRLFHVDSWYRFFLDQVIALVQKDAALLFWHQTPRGYYVEVTPQVLVYHSVWMGLMRSLAPEKPSLFYWNVFSAIASERFSINPNLYK